MPDLATLHHAADLAAFAYQGYFDAGNEGPISITPATLGTGAGRFEAVTLVGLAGTDIERVRDSNQAVGIREDILAGLGSDRNAYFREAKAAILETVEPGSALVLAGHSLGGMIAQQLAADPELQDLYDIRHTVAFGSPLIRPGQREGQVERLGDAGDLIPQLSLAGFVLPWWRDFGLNRELSPYSTQGTIAAHTRSYVDPEVWGGYDAVGVRGGAASITYDPAQVRFFDAPRVPQTLEERSDRTTPEPEVLTALAASAPALLDRLTATAPEERQALADRLQDALGPLTGAPLRSPSTPTVLAPLSERPEPTLAG